MPPKRKLTFEPPADEESNESTDDSEEEKRRSSRPRINRVNVNRSRQVESDDESEEEQNWFEWIINSYHEFSNDMKECLENRPFVNIAVVLLIFLVIYSPIILAEPNSINYYHRIQKSSGPKLDEVLRGFSNDFEKIFPKNDYFKAVLLSAVHKILIHPDSGAATITIGLSKDYDYSSLKNSLSKLFSIHLKYYMKNYVIPNEGETNEVTFYKTIMNLLGSVNGRSILFVDGIDRLEGRAPLTLQTLSDEDAAKFKNSVLILTVSDDSFKSLDRYKCNKEINEFLVKTWKSEVLLEDQIFPIVSRITKLTVCF